MAGREFLKTIKPFVYIFYCVLIVVLTSTIELLEKYEKLDVLEAKQYIITLPTSPLPIHGNEAGSQYDRTVGTPNSTGTTGYKPETLEWYRNDDNPILYRQQSNLTYLFASHIIPLN